MRLIHVLFAGALGLAPFAANAMHYRTCIEQADDFGDFTIFQAERLCTGAMSILPAVCGNLAAQHFTTEQAVTLCMYAQSNIPVQCALAGERSSLTLAQLTYTCNQAQNTAPAECAMGILRLRPYIGSPFTGDQIAKICFGAVDMTPAYCVANTFAQTRSVLGTFNACRAYQPVVPFNPGGGFPIPYTPGPLPLPGGGGTGTGQFINCVLKTAVKPDGYTGIGFTDDQAKAAAKDQCLQVESVLACGAGTATCPPH